MARYRRRPRLYTYRLEWADGLVNYEDFESFGEMIEHARKTEQETGIPLVAYEEQWPYEGC